MVPACTALPRDASHKRHSSSGVWPRMVAAPTIDPCSTGLVRRSRHEPRTGIRMPLAQRCRCVPGVARVGRSEEHTSELQSLMRISYAVFCLKKNTHLKQNEHTYVT